MTAAGVPARDVECAGHIEVTRSRARRCVGAAGTSTNAARKKRCRAGPHLTKEGRSTWEIPGMEMDGRWPARKDPGNRIRERRASEPRRDTHRDPRQTAPRWRRRGVKSGSDGGRSRTLNTARSRSDEVVPADHHHELLRVHGAVRMASEADDLPDPLPRNVGRGSIAGFVFLVLVRTSRTQPLVVTFYTAVGPRCDRPVLRAAALR